MHAVLSSDDSKLFSKVKHRGGVPVFFGPGTVELILLRCHIH